MYTGIHICEPMAQLKIIFYLKFSRKRVVRSRYQLQKGTTLFKNSMINFH